MHDFILASFSNETVHDRDRELDPIRLASYAGFPPDRSRLYCSECKEVVTGMTPAEAAQAFNTDLQDIGFLLRKEDIHTVGRDPLALSICGTSIEWCFESRQTRLLDSHFEIAIQETMSDSGE